MLIHYYFNWDNSLGLKLLQNANKMALVLVMVTLLFVRGLIFLQKWTVVDEPVISIDGKVVTIRDIWISLLDVLYVRAFYSAIDMFLGFDLNTISAYEVGVKVSNDPLPHEP